MNVSCIVAPYEADAQLAYLYRQKVISLAISEDTDLLVFGCDRVFYKMDANGKGVLVDAKRISLFPSVDSATNKILFRHLCILAGCDYLSNLKGIAIKTAFQSLKDTKNVFDTIRDFRSKKGVQVVPKTFEDDFKNAESMFLKQLVFDIKKCTLVEITTLIEHDTYTSNNQ